MSIKKSTMLALCVIGIGISSYLAYGKLTSNELICNSNFSCSVIQNSQYSTLLGIPIGVWGMGYYFVLFTFLYLKASKLTILGGKLLLAWGLVFSSYLTYLEAFVINAFCMWCLLSFANIIILNIIYFSGKQSAVSAPITPQKN